MKSTILLLFWLTALFLGLKYQQDKIFILGCTIMGLISNCTRLIIVKLNTLKHINQKDIK